MDNSKKKKIFWLVVIILVIIGVLFFFLVIRDKNTTEIVPEGNETTPEFTAPSANIKFDPELEPKVGSTEFSVINLARNYVERLGSWSTDNQLHNLEELIPLSSASMRNYIESVQANYENQNFEGITTKSLSAKIVYSDDISAEVSVMTQRIKTSKKASDSDLKQEVYNQSAMVYIIKSGSTWLVDDVEWQ